MKSGFRETHIKVIEIPESPAVIDIIIKHIYQQHVKVSDYELAARVYVASQKYLLNTLAGTVTAYIMNQCHSTSEILTVLKIIHPTHKNDKNEENEVWKMLSKLEDLEISSADIVIAMLEQSRVYG